MCDAVDTGRKRFTIPSVIGEVRRNRCRVAPVIPYMGTRVLREPAVSLPVTLPWLHLYTGTLLNLQGLPTRTKKKEEEEFIPSTSANLQGIPRDESPSTARQEIPNKHDLLPGQRTEWNETIRLQDSTSLLSPLPVLLLLLFSLINPPFHLLIRSPTKVRGSC